MSAVPRPLPCHSGATPITARYQCGGRLGCLASMRIRDHSARGRRLPNARSMAGPSRRLAVIGTCHSSGGPHTAAPTSSSVVQTSPRGSATERNSVSKKIRRRSVRLASSGSTCEKPGSSAKARARASPSASASSGNARRMSPAAGALCGAWSGAAASRPRPALPHDRRGDRGRGGPRRGTSRG